jgi:hypothetical protein
VSYTRLMLSRWFKGDERMIRAMEEQQSKVEAASSGLQTTAQTTDRIEAASVLVLAGNNAFTNERVLELGSGLAGVDDGNTLRLSTSKIVPLITGDFRVSIVASGDSQFQVPFRGTLATIANPETLSNKTLDKPKVSGLGNYTSDAAAATGGVPVGGLYHNAGVVRIRLA